MKAIGWVALVLVLLALARFAFTLPRPEELKGSPTVAAARPAPTPAPVYTLSVVSVECSGRGRDLADVTIRNVGNTQLSFAKAYVEFKDQSGAVISAQDSYFHPLEIPPGATASADVYSSGNGAYSCALTAVQDRIGNQATLR